MLGPGRSWNKGQCEMSWAFLLFVQRGLSWAPFVSLSLPPFFLCGYLCHKFCAKDRARYCYHYFCCQIQQSLIPSASRWWSIGNGSCDGDKVSVTKPNKKAAAWWAGTEGSIRGCDICRESMCTNEDDSSGEMTLEWNPLAWTVPEDDDRAERPQGTEGWNKKQYDVLALLCPKVSMSSRFIWLFFFQYWELNPGPCLY